ncbi:hypothetical protein OUZ56_028866 [Daphnia magna]|uniref:Uncharacterized protein n=1 Tax=Daphnia magna TaxID=35525 RepID=A0ABR0B553_9CRUS|nr:hypothetical protein OUZ56_028866 [Daphnia magna]
MDNSESKSEYLATIFCLNYLSLLFFFFNFHLGANFCHRRAGTKLPILVGIDPLTAERDDASLY